MRQFSAGQPRMTAPISLALAGVSSALVYGAIYLRLPLARTYGIPLLNLNNIAPAEWPTGLLVVGCIAFLFGAYLLGALSLARGPADRRAPLLIAGGGIAFVALLLLVHPMTSTDVYDYLFRGRMLARYGANPFVATPSEFKSDPLIRYVAWKQAVTAYGPLWEGLSWVVARLAGEMPGPAPLDPSAQLLRLIVAYKIVAALGFLLCGAAIWIALGRAAPEHRQLGLYLWLWNPLALWETIGVAHNDAWMALCIVLAIAAFRTRPGDQETRRPGDQERVPRYTLISLLPILAALLALAAGGLIKYVAFFFGPVALVAALRRMPGWRARLRLVTLGGLACGALVALAYAPFWAGAQTLQNVRDRRGLYTSTWLAALHAAIAPLFAPDRSAAIVASASLALLLLGIGWAAWRAWRAPDRLVEHMLWLALWFLFVGNTWFQPWYAIWPLALVALQPWRARAAWGVGLLCATALLGYIAGGLLAPALGLQDKTIGRELLMAALIYIPPLLVLGRGWLMSAWQALARRPAARLWIYGLGMLVPILAFAWRYPLGPNSSGLTDIGKLSGYAAAPFAGYVAGMAALFALYLLALRESRRLTTHTALPAVFGCAALMTIGMDWMYPVNAIDLFLYAARSRLLTSYGANPNAALPRDFPADAWSAYMTPEWAGHVSPYGPLWNLVAAPITWLAGDRMIVALLGLKILLAAALLLGGWAIVRALAAAGRSDAASGALLYLWNPLVLWEGIGNGHNDVLLALPLLLALWAWIGRRDKLVIPLLVIAALIKYVTLPLIPLALIALWRRAEHGARWRTLGWSAALSVAAVAVALYPFYDLGAVWGSLAGQSAIIYTSPASAAIALLHARLPDTAIRQWAALLGGGAVLVVWAYQAGALSRRHERLPRACFEVVYVFLLAAVWNLRPWYLIWPVTLAALLPWGGPARRMIAWTIGGAASYAFLIWVEAWWQPGYDLAQIVGVALMVGPTLLAGAAELAGRARRRRGSSPPIELPRGSSWEA
ncbi:MAG: hypothetical protein IPO81_15135 [Kouleothrix sp.]|nr:hypothetical protein [Kouleothrix sp.]